MRLSVSLQFGISSILLILLVLAIAGQSYSFLSSAQEHDTRQRLEAQVESIKDRFTYVVQSASDIVRLAQASDIGSGQCSDLLEAVQRERERYNVIAVGGRDGIIRCATPRNAVGIDISDRPWFQTALQTDQTAIGTAQISRTTGEYNIIVVTPLSQDLGADVVGVGAGIRLQWLSEFLGPIPSGQNGVIGIIDDQLNVIARYPDPEKWVGTAVRNEKARTLIGGGESGVLTVRGFDGIERFFYAEPFEMAGRRFHAYAGIPQTSITELATQSSLYTLVVGFLTVALIAILNLVLSQRNFVEPLRRMGMAASELAAGNYDARVDLEQVRTREIADLSTALNRVGQSLHTKDRDLNQACELASLGYWSYDRNRQTMYLSPAMRDIYGFDVDRAEPSPDEMIERVHPEDRPGVRNMLQSAIEFAERITHDYRVCWPDGTIRHCRAGAGPSADDEAPSSRLSGFCQDITEQVELERKVLQAQRMEAIGQLTGGVAHDFNNLLTVILGNGEILADALENDERLGHLARLTRDAAERGADLTARLLAFARQQALEPRTVDVNAMVTDMMPLLKRTLGEETEIMMKLSEDIRHAFVDPAQLESALLNLSINARDAMPEGGTLTVETDTIVIGEGEVGWDRESFRPGEYVVLAVSDTGVGMTGQTMRQAVEPFFTTKDVGQGSGLGLSMVHGFLRQSGGHMRIYSEVDEGTTVKLFLPMARLDHENAGDGRASTDADGGDETILVVEDDPMVLDYVAGQLSGLGYTVLSAHDGQQALETARQTPDIDLLFTDVVMPGGMSGKALAEEIRDLVPGIRVLYTSGYSKNVIVHGGRVDADVELLSKPYRRDELARKVRKILDTG